MAGARCETCPMRIEAEKNPNTFKARLWRWHTKFCPGWKKYQKSLSANTNQNGN